MNFRFRKSFLAAIAVLFICSLSGAFVPNFINNFDMFAQRAGRDAKLAEEIYYNDREYYIGYYTCNLDELLAIDRYLTDDPEVTFNFGYCTETGFALYTKHNRGSGHVFTVHD